MIKVVCYVSINRVLLNMPKTLTTLINVWAVLLLLCFLSLIVKVQAQALSEIKLQQTLEDFVIISINLDADIALAKGFLLENSANFSVIFDPKGAIAQNFNIKGMPSSLLIDRQGQIQQAHSGFFTNKVTLYEAQLSALLAIK